MGNPPHHSIFIFIRTRFFYVILHLFGPYLYQPTLATVINRVSRRVDVMENTQQAVAPKLSSNISSPERTIRFPILERTPMKKTDSVQRTLRYFSNFSHLPPRHRVVTPQPLRPIRSTIIIGEYARLPIGHGPPVPKLGKDLEAALEIDNLPAVITDSKCRVRAANSKYMEMVWQPECRWLNYLVVTELSLTTPTRTSAWVGRINGEVIMDLSQCTPGPEPGMVKEGFGSDERFLCMVRVEWQVGQSRKSVTCACDVISVYCVSNDYTFVWRFHSHHGEFDV